MKRVEETISEEMIIKGTHWTKEEHQMFLDGLELFGKNWKEISKYVKSRTSEQCRSHGQKHFIKLQENRVSKRDMADRYLSFQLPEKPEMRSIGIQYGEGVYIPTPKFGPRY